MDPSTAEWFPLGLCQSHQLVVAWPTSTVCQWLTLTAPVVVPVQEPYPLAPHQLQLRLRRTQKDPGLWNRKGWFCSGVGRSKEMEIKKEMYFGKRRLRTKWAKHPLCCMLCFCDSCSCFKHGSIILNVRMISTLVLFAIDSFKKLFFFIIYIYYITYIYIYRVTSLLFSN